MLPRAVSCIAKNRDTPKKDVPHSSEAEAARNNKMRNSKSLTHERKNEAGLRTRSQTRGFEFGFYPIPEPDPRLCTVSTTRLEPDPVEEDGEPFFPASFGF